MAIKSEYLAHLFAHYCAKQAVDIENHRVWLARCCDSQYILLGHPWPPIPTNTPSSREADGRFGVSGLFPHTKERTHANVSLADAGTCGGVHPASLWQN
jgi:hypothetical protein